MTDITPLFTTCLKTRGTPIRSSHHRVSDTTDEFLKEAYRINAHITSLHQYLLRIRQPYLSTSPSSHRRPSDSHLTDSERNRIDQESKSLLRDLQFSIQQLSAAATLRYDTQWKLAQRKHGGGGAFLRRWANGGKNLLQGGDDEEKLRAEKTWRESVVWYLGRGLEAAGEVQRGMMERRLEREVERSRSVLYMSRGSGAGVGVGMGDGGAAGGSGAGAGPEVRKGAGERGGDPIGGGPNNTSRSPINPSTKQTWNHNRSSTEEASEPSIETNLTPAQLQLFAEENQAMLKQYEDTLDQVRTAESSLLEISSLQTQLSQSLNTQSAHITQLVADAGNITTDVDRGNKELKSAGERRSVARSVFWATCGLSAGLVLWDLVF